ncbi:MAG: hypothetical protein ABIT04_02065 [Novosphingobium sp.]
MEPETQTDHIALLALMICGTLIKRLDDIGQLDEPTGRRLHHLVNAVRTHANSHNAADLKILFDNIDLSLGDKGARAAAAPVE